MTELNPRRVVITGITGARNRGVEALAVTAIDNIERTFPGSQITIASTDPEFDRRCFKDRATVLDDCRWFYGKSKNRRRLRYPFRMREPHPLKLLRDAIDQADLVLASGGDIFSIDYGVDFLRRQLAILEDAQDAGAKTVFFGHSIGPFAEQSEIDLIAPVLQRSALVTLRESASYDYVLKTMGVPADRVVLTGDVAFLMEPSAPDRVATLKRMAGLEEGKPYIAIAPSQGITSFATSKGLNNHDEAWIKTIRFLLDSTDCDILIVPHVQDLNVRNDDSQIAFRLMEALEGTPRLRAAFGIHSAKDYKGMIKDASLLIGERMHACIAGLSQNVPTLTIGYSVKAVGIMRDLFGAEAERSGLLVPVNDFVQDEGFTAMLGQAWEARADARTLLEGSTPAMKARAQKNFDLLKTL